MTRLQLLRRGGAGVLGLSSMNLLAACGGSTTDGDGATKASGTVTIVAASSMTYVPDVLIPMYKKANPGVKVNYSGVPFTDLATKYTTTIAAQDGSADLLYGYVNPIRGFNNKLFADVSKDLAPELQLYSEFVRTTLTSALVLMYRSDLWEKAGFSAPPKTWAEATAQLQKVKQDNKSIQGIEIALGAADTAWNLFNPFINAAGAKVYADDLKTIQFDSTGGVKAVEALADLGKAGVMSPNSFTIAQIQEANKHFAAGNLAAILTTDTAYKSLQDPSASKVVDKVGVTLCPGIVNPLGAWAASEGLGLNKFAKNKEQALHFLRFLASRPAVEATVKLGLPTGQTEIRQEALKASPSPALEASTQAIEQGTKQGDQVWAAPWGSKANPEIQPILIDVAKGKTSAEEGTQKITEALRRSAGAA
jgi:multiple sugar transport system substrate-binding protein